MEGLPVLVRVTLAILHLGMDLHVGPRGCIASLLANLDIQVASHARVPEKVELELPRVLPFNFQLNRNRGGVVPSAAAVLDGHQVAAVLLVHHWLNHFLSACFAAHLAMFLFL